MSNHLHVVLHINSEKAASWSTLDVLKRWHKLHKGTLFTQQYVRGELMPEYATALVESSAETFRNRLMDISWFMKELNEPIARRANFEDKCTGRYYSLHFICSPFGPAKAVQIFSKLVGRTIQVSSFA